MDGTEEMKNVIYHSLLANLMMKKKNETFRMIDTFQAPVLKQIGGGRRENSAPER